MKFLKKLQKPTDPQPVIMGIDLAQPQTLKLTDPVDTGITTLNYSLAATAPKKPTLEEALDVLSEHGFLLKSVDVNTSYSYDAMPEIDLMIRICPPPQQHQKIMSALHGWYNNKFYGGKF